VEYLKALNQDYKKELEDLLSTKPGGGKWELKDE
jgi:hypothetical protein